MSKGDCEMDTFLDIYLYSEPAKPSLECKKVLLEEVGGAMSVSLRVARMALSLQRMLGVCKDA